MQNDTVRSTFENTTPRDVVIAGLVAGGTLELAFSCYRHMDVQKLQLFVRRHPGYITMAMFSAVGAGLTVRDYFGQKASKTAQ